MRLLFFSSCYGAGLTSLLTQQAIALSQHLGPDLLCVTGETEQFDGLGGKLQRHGIACDIMQGLDVHSEFRRLVRELAEKVRSFRPDVVQVQTNWQLAIAAAVRASADVNFRLVYWVHGFRHNYPVRSLIATAMIGTALWAAADRVVVPSQCVQNQFKFLRNRLVTLYQGVDRSYLEAPHVIDVDAMPKRLVFAAQFRKGKNQHTIIRALADYVRATGDSSVELVLPGTGDLQPMCQRLAATLGIERLVRFPGQLNRQQMLAAYQEAQCAVVPTNAETFGNCISEPFVLGRILMTRPVGVSENVIRDGENGFLFNTEADLAALFRRVLPNLRAFANVAQTAYSQRSLFDWTRIMPDYLDMLGSLIRTARPSAAQ